MSRQLLADWRGLGCFEYCVSRRTRWVLTVALLRISQIADAMCMHDRSPDVALTLPRPVAGPYTDAQLHAKACIYCGRGDGELLPAGHIRVENRPGQMLPWPVAACPGHQTGVAA